MVRALPVLLLVVAVLQRGGWGSSGNATSGVLSTSTVVPPSNSSPTPTTSTLSSLIAGDLRLSTTVNSTRVDGDWSHECPEACLCGREPLPSWVVGADLDVVGDLGDLGDLSVSRPLMACFGMPQGLSGDLPAVEVLRVSNSSGPVRRLDFWSLRRLPGLLLLDMQGNGVSELSGSGKGNPDLRALDLSANSVHVLGAFAFRDLAALRLLNLSANGLHSIAPSALALPRLAVLDLRRNKLAVLKPHFFADAPSLRALYLAENVLSRVPALVLPGGALRVLDLSANHIIRVEEAAFDGVNVTGLLDLGRNALRRVPNKALRRLGAVRDLVLSDNPLGALAGGAVSGLAARTLHLQRIKALTTVHRGAIQGLAELRELRLSANAELTYVHPEALGDVPRLHTLDLTATPLLTLERGLLDAAPALRTLRLDNGTLHCHCSLGWLHSVPGLTQGAVSCRGPQGRPQEVPSSQPACAPYIIPLFPETLSETLGNNASFPCRALGGDEVTWRTPSRGAGRGAELRVGQCDGPRACVRDDHVLSVLYLHAEDAGTYTCTARGHAGQDERSVRLHVRDVHVRLLPLTVTSTFVTLAWNMSSAVTNSYTLRVEEVDGDAPSSAPPRAVTFTVGLKMHSYTVHGLKPRARYAFTLAIQREQYSLVIGSTTVTTREGAFLVSLGIERNYLSMIAVAVLGGASAAACLGVCGLRCWRQRLRLREAALRKSDSAFSGREMLSGSPSRASHASQLSPTASDSALALQPRALFGGITYISLASERAPSEPGDRALQQDLISFT